MHALSHLATVTAWPYIDNAVDAYVLVVSSKSSLYLLPSLNIRKIETYSVLLPE